MTKWLLLQIRLHVNYKKRKIHYSEQKFSSQLNPQISIKFQTAKKQKWVVVVGIDLCVYPEYATEQNSSRNQGRHIGLPLRLK